MVLIFCRFNRLYYLTRNSRKNDLAILNSNYVNKFVFSVEKKKATCHGNEAKMLLLKLMLYSGYESSKVCHSIKAYLYTMNLVMYAFH